MKSLILVRHAKSSWNLPLEDKQRPITLQGSNAIKKVALTVQNFIESSPTIYCSTAIRTTQTALLFCETLGIAKDSICFEEKLYTFSANQLEDFIKKMDNSKNEIILFGHNEGITDFVNKFGDEYIYNVPTAGIVFLQFETTNWENINKGKTIRFFFPKEIE